MSHAQNKRNQQTEYHLYRATVEQKQYFLNFLNSLNHTDEFTQNHKNHTLSYAIAYEFIHKILNAEQIDNDKKYLILFVGREQTISLGEQKSIIDLISSEREKLPKSTVVSACSINSPETKPNIIDKFLTKIISNDGKVYTINERATDVSVVATAALVDVWFEWKNLIRNMQVHRPHRSVTSNDEILSVTMACNERGVFGIELDFKELAEDIIHFYNKFADCDETYAFVADMDGFALFHPTFPRSQRNSNEFVFPVDIRLLEKIDDRLWSRLTNESTGFSTVHTMTQKVGFIMKFK